MDYIDKAVTVSGENGKSATGRALVDSACPYNVMPRSVARRIGMKLGLVATLPSRLAGTTFYYREGAARVRLEGGCQGDAIFRVAETPWHKDRFAEHILLGSRFLQASGAKINYGRKYRGSHPVSNPLESLSSYADVDDDPTRFVDRGFVECPVCHAPVYLTARGDLRRHFTGARGRRVTCQGSDLRVVRSIER